MVASRPTEGALVEMAGKRFTQEERRAIVLLAKGHTRTEVETTLVLSSSGLSRILAGLFKRYRTKNITQTVAVLVASGVVTAAEIGVSAPGTYTGAEVAEILLRDLIKKPLDETEEHINWLIEKTAREFERGQR